MAKRAARITVIKPEYVYLRLKPNNSIRNTDTHLIARTIATLYRGLWNCLKWEEMKAIRLFRKEYVIGTRFSYTLQGKISYYVYMEKEKVEFYFIVPYSFLDVIKERLGSVWNGITMEEVVEIPTFSENAFKYQMVYEKEDALSLRTNRSDNSLLNASLNVIDLMEEQDRAGILYNFIPVAQGSFAHSYKATIDKVKNGMPTERNKFGLLYLIKMGISLVDSIFNDITEALAGKNEKKNEENVLDTIIEKLNGGKQISESTEKKIRGHVLDTQILIFSESPDAVKARNHASSIAQSFDVLTGDNRLIKKRYSKGTVNYTATRINGAETNRVGDQEVQSFISIAGRELLERYPFMDRVETQEIQIPKELQKGVMCIGDVTYRGQSQRAYLSDDEQFKKLMLLLIGPSRAGKSNLISHLSIDAIDNGECVVIFDFIKNCELSKSVAECFPDDQVLRIRCDDFENLQGIGYNEVGYSSNAFKQYDNAKRQTTNTLMLIDSINVGSGDSSKLTPKMERYLESACLVVYISGGSMKDVFGVLLNHETRHNFINKVPKNQLDNLRDYIDSIKEIDDKDKAGKVTGTKVQAGIIDRLNALKRNTYVELMLKKGTKNNINLVDEMQKNQLIVIEMPQAMFTTDAEKDIFTTYWMSKIWLGLQVRADLYEEKDLKKVNVVIDEIYQVEHTEQFLKSKLSQLAKFGMKPIVSCHYINQLKYLREELRSANTSYMLIAGSDKKNFDELKDELYPFTAEDLKDMKRYHSLNYIKTKDGYARFITKLPGEVSSRITSRTKPQQIENVTEENLKVGESNVIDKKQ
ncbi:hypothetical protein [Sporosarcina jiandibaonis]|uniref:hypothetical protein n=1 Tax=Sporosarcina jiandibaonis TaxID=2715535 RepID=UPI001C130E11|nr:hypothetical protein [Sporosarcina jiandibaonis]